MKKDIICNKLYRNKILYSNSQYIQTQKEATLISDKDINTHPFCFGEECV